MITANDFRPKIPGVFASRSLPQSFLAELPLTGPRPCPSKPFRRRKQFSHPPCFSALHSSRGHFRRPSSPGLEGYRKQCADKGLPTDDEITVLFAMFPQQIEALIKGVPVAENKPAPAPAKAAPAPAPAPAPASAAYASANPKPAGSTQMVLSINGERHEVTVERLPS